MGRERGNYNLCGCASSMKLRWYIIIQLPGLCGVCYKGTTSTVARVVTVFSGDRPTHGCVLQSYDRALSCMYMPAWNIEDAVTFTVMRTNHGEWQASAALFWSTI